MLSLWLYKNPKGLYQTPPGELQAEEGSAELGTFSLLERTNNFQVLSGAPISLRTLVMLMKDPSSLFIRAHLQKTSLQLLCVHVLLYVSAFKSQMGAPESRACASRIRKSLVSVSTHPIQVLSWKSPGGEEAAETVARGDGNKDGLGQEGYNKCHDVPEPSFFVGQGPPWLWFPLVPGPPDLP